MTTVIFSNIILYGPFGQWSFSMNRERPTLRTIVRDVTLLGKITWQNFPIPICLRVGGGEGQP